MVTYIWEHIVELEHLHEDKWQPFTQFEIDAASMDLAVDNAICMMTEKYPEWTGKLRVSECHQIGRRELLRG